VTDPWGTEFRLVRAENDERDPRGRQAGNGVSEGMAIRDLTIYTPVGANFDGIARFYNEVLGAPILQREGGDNRQKCVVSVGPKHTLTFVTDPKGRSSSVLRHDDLRDDGLAPPEGLTTFMSNYGPHVSIYVADFVDSYRRAEQLGVAYVNPRFKRRAYTLDDAVDDCMFRCLDIVDPAKRDAGPIIRLEHEVRSVVRRDGTRYKSCPFDEIPKCCKRPQ